MRFLTKALIAAAALSAPALANAAPLTVVNVAAPAINCVFNTSCTITVNDSIGNFTLPGDSGTGLLQSRTFDGAAGAPAAGKFGYDYRIVMTGMHAATAANCIGTLKVNFGAPLTFAYKPGVPSQVFVVTVGGLGAMGPTSASISGSVVTFNFATPVCPGQTSYFFGLAANNDAADGPAQMIPTPGAVPVTVDGRAPHP
ncbi:MAG TPA: hypothetical protein VGF56_09040 [Rhizomicrobium sp.]|jgi:hypothetical protein